MTSRYLHTVFALLLAWVMWEETVVFSNNMHIPNKWDVEGAFETREQCQENLKKTVEEHHLKKFGKQVDSDSILIFAGDGKTPMLKYQYFCLPDTVDPRDK